MSDLICRKTMMRCMTPGMCSPFGGCRDTDHDRIVAGLQAQVEQMAERCRELEARMDGIAGDGALAEERCNTLSAENESLRKENERLATLIEDNAEAGTLRAEVERLRKDAERYRLLRAGNDYQYDGPMVVLYEKTSDLGERPYWSLAAEALDDAIDAAMEAGLVPAGWSWEQHGGMCNCFPYDPGWNRRGDDGNRYWIERGFTAPRPLYFQTDLQMAAPDLLKALENLLRQVEQYDLPLSDPERIAARAAIAKALGQA